jgi:hypothetical protein
MFIGGSLGSLGASWAYAQSSWLGVCAYGAALAVAGLLLQLLTLLPGTGRKAPHH